MNKEFIMLVYGAILIAVLLGAGQYAKRFVKDSSDFIIAGRETSSIINIMGVVAIGFAGTSITLAPGFTIQYGLVGGLMWGVLYSAAGLILYGLVFSRFARLSGAQTLPEYFEMRYSKNVRTVVAITSVLGMCGILANNIVSLTNFVGGYTGWPSWAIMGVAFLVILVFATTSGMWATNLTDFIQVAVGTIGVPVFLLMLINRFGGFDYISANWPGTNSDWINYGITGMQMPVNSFKYPSALTFILTFAAALVWGNNYYWIKLATARNEKVARNSFVYGGIYLIIIFMIPLTLIGAFTGAFMSTEFSLLGGSHDATAAYGLIAQVITPLLGSLFIMAATGASISTSSTSALGATSTASRDIYQQIVKPNASPDETLNASRWIMVIIILITWGMTFFPGGPTYLFAFANAWLTPPAVLLLLGVTWPRFNKYGAFYGVILGMLSMIILTILQLTGIFNIAQYTHMAIVGFAVTLVVSVVVSLASKSAYYSNSDWKENISKEKIEFNEQESKVLNLIGLGHIYMADITDALQIDSKYSNAIIEKLEKTGYISRKGKTWTSFYTFNLTEKGKDYVRSDVQVINEKMDDYVNDHYLKFMNVIKESDRDLGKFQKENNIGSLQMSSMISHLVRRGYVEEYGIYNRRVKLSDSGQQLLKKYS